MIHNGKHLMKTSLIFFIAVICLIVWQGCNNHDPKAINNLDIKNTTAVVSSSAKVPDLSSDFLVSVYEKQELIKISQEDKELRQKYCDESYLKQEKLFISMGIGALRNPETGQPVPQHLAERAATLDAKRWASYGELWLTNNYEPPFGKLTSTFNRTVTVINKAVVGDSLFVFVATSLP